MRQAQAGDSEAWELIVQKTSHRIYFLCLKMWKGNVANAEDSTQDTYLQAFRKLHTYRGEAAFTTWIYRIAINAVLQQLRRATMETVPLESSSQENYTKNPGALFGNDDNIDPAAVIGENDRYAETVIFRKFAWDLIRQLPDGCRQALFLHDIMGYEHHEIARMRGCSIGNSKSQLHKARRRMLELIAESRDIPIHGGKQTSLDLLDLLKPHIKIILS